MKVVVVSDTHTQHEQLGVLSGDVLIHCGDGGLGRRASLDETRRLDAWFGRQDFKLILCTGGNHDFALEQASARQLPTFQNAVYLENQSVLFDGKKFYGAPWVPELRGWAYFQDDLSLHESWRMIPEDTDVLVTHTPAYAILDSNSQGRLCGCRALRTRVEELHLQLHCFGHIHASAGMVTRGGATFVNGSVVNHAYQIARSAIEIEI